jgi:hypothetical protein
MFDDVTAEEIARFMRYVDKLPCGCWFWLGGRSKGRGNRKPYGSFKYRGKTVRAHVFACHAIGKKPALPAGHERDHRCKFSLCVNPDCIEIVPREVNNERRWQGKRKTDKPDEYKMLLDYIAIG